MSADDIARAHELIELCSRHFLEQASQTTAQNVSAVVKQAVAIQRRSMIEERVNRALGIPYDYFLANGKAQLPETVFEQLVTDITRMPLECSLLLCTFIGGQPIVFEVDSDGSVRFQEHFAAIGSGTFIAHPALFQREHEADLPIGQAVYHVYEAMKLGAIAPGVGDDFSLSIITRHGSDGKLQLQRPTDRGIAFLARQYKKYGLKQFYGFSFPRRYLETW